MATWAGTSVKIGASPEASRDTGETVAAWAGTRVRIAASPEAGVPHHAFLDVGAGVSTQRACSPTSRRLDHKAMNMRMSPTAATRARLWPRGRGLCQIVGVAHPDFLDVAKGMGLCMPSTLPIITQYGPFAFSKEMVA
jgi:hypothetical protein